MHVSCKVLVGNLHVSLLFLCQKYSAFLKMFNSIIIVINELLNSYYLSVMPMIFLKYPSSLSTSGYILV